MGFNSLSKDVLWLILRRVILEECVESNQNYYRNIDDVVSGFQTMPYVTSNWRETNQIRRDLLRMTVCGIVRNLRYVCQMWRSLLRQKCLPGEDSSFKFKPGSFL